MDSLNQKIIIIGSGYVGFSLAVMLSQYHAVSILDIDEEKIEKIKLGKSPIKDSLVSQYLKKKNLNLEVAKYSTTAFTDANIVIIATPTDYDDDTNCFNTDTVDKIVDEIFSQNLDIFIVIKSTLPEGHTSYLRKKT